MHRLVVTVLAGFVLAGCAENVEPLAQMPELSEVEAEVASETPPEGLPQIAEGEGIGASAPAGTEVLAADDADLADPLPAEKRRFWPFGRKAEPVEVAENTPDKAAIVADATDASDEDDSAQHGEAALGDLVEPEKRRRLFGFLRSDSRGSTDVGEENIILASLGPVDTGGADQVADDPVTPKRRGLFAGFRRNAPANATGDRNVQFGTILPFGELGRVCAIPIGRLGKLVAKYPEDQPIYHIYDADPGNLEAHNYYLTGFPDNCARVFNAALAMFGSPLMHEQLRYGLPAETIPYSATDRAYERVKSRVCHVGRRKPCGDKIGLLDINTVFITLYENFEGTAEWSNLLLHDGQIMGADTVGG